ncbi:MAG: hypothetical protein Q8K60_00325 [Parachlamydiaceae bacterium]|nr:hypothetical protein [Parachlamydiaceae bacterium]
MTELNFIFQPGIWLGSGTITLVSSPEKINFYTKWTIQKENQNKIESTQIIEIDGVQEHIVNKYVFYEISENDFKTVLESEHIGKVEGNGKKHDKCIEWHFKVPPLCIGNELYEKNEDGSYSFKAEYGTEEAFESQIEGKLWLKSSDV